jgi:hypothetical protein
VDHAREELPQSAIRHSHLLRQLARGDGHRDAVRPKILGSEPFAQLHAAKELTEARGHRDVLDRVEPQQHDRRSTEAICPGSARRNALFTTLRMRVTSAGSCETIWWSCAAVLLGSSTVLMIRAVTSGSVAIVVTFFNGLLNDRLRINGGCGCGRHVYFPD